MSRPPVGFEPTISAGDRPQTYALDRAATGVGAQSVYLQILRKQHDRVQQCTRHNSIMTCTQEFFLIYYTKYFQHGPQYKQI